MRKHHVVVEKVSVFRSNSKVAVGETSLPCKAPWNNMYFNTCGDAAPCWKLIGHTAHYDKNLNTINNIWKDNVPSNWRHNAPSADSSVHEPWKDHGFQKYRDALSNNEFLGRCQECKNDMEHDVWSLATAYDNFPRNENGYPSLLEIEVSNKCNLECIMCEPNLSSGLAKKAGLPLLKPYDDEFRQELKEYIPHLTEIRFNGGEPFLHKMVYDICDDIVELNPGLTIGIATNGSVMNKNVERLLANNNVKPQVSIDSLIPERYSQIRVNGDLPKLLDNFEKFKEYARKNNTKVIVVVNPMRNNWEEMPSFLDFVREHDAGLWYNSILHPEHLTIKGLPSKELEHIYKSLSYETSLRINPNPKYAERDGNFKTLENLVENKIKTWWEESLV